MGGSKRNFVPYPTFLNKSPTEEGQALHILGRCRINPLSYTNLTEQINKIYSKNVDQSKVDEQVSDAEVKESNKKLKKKFMKQGVAMAQSYISDTLKLDSSVIDIEILTDAVTVLSSRGCITACLLDAGCDKVAIACQNNDDTLKALHVSRVPKERLAAHFHASVSKDILASVLEYTDTISIELKNPPMDFQKYKDIIQEISEGAKSVTTPKDININFHIPASIVDECEDLIPDILNHFKERETPKGTVFLIDPTAQQLGKSYASCICTDRSDKLYSTVVCSRAGEALGLVYSSKESIVASLECGRSVYFSRSRNQLWRKGDTSGHYQLVHKIDVDCDGDALRFMVTQYGDGGTGAFCHLGTLTCWGNPTGLRQLEAILMSRLGNSPEGSYTKRLFDDSELLRNKLVEEAQELAEEHEKKGVAEELADVLYFAMVKAVKSGVSIDDAISELDKKARKVTRRKGDSKTYRIEAANKILNEK